MASATALSHLMPTPHSRVLWLCAATLAATLTGCNTERLASVAPKQAPVLAGHWTLDTAHSEGIGTAIAALDAQLHKRLRLARRAARRAGASDDPPHRRTRTGESDQHERTSRTASPDIPREPSVAVNAPLPGADLVREFVASVPAGRYLGIRFTPDQITVLSAGGAQECAPGVPTAITFGQGTAAQTCGWHQKAFMIRLKPLIGPTFSERFTLAPDGELVMTLRLAGNGIDVRLVRRYRRTPHAAVPALLPTSD